MLSVLVKLHGLQVSLLFTQACCTSGPHYFSRYSLQSPVSHVVCSHANGFRLCFRCDQSAWSVHVDLRRRGFGFHFQHPDDDNNSNKQRGGLNRRRHHQPHTFCASTSANRASSSLKAFSALARFADLSAACRAVRPRSLLVSITPTGPLGFHTIVSEQQHFFTRRKIWTATKSKGMDRKRSRLLRTYTHHCGSHIVHLHEQLVGGIAPYKTLQCPPPVPLRRKGLHLR